MSIKLEDFKSQLKDGARPNRFSVKISGNQAGASWSEPLTFFTKTFSLPARTHGEIVVNYAGMQTKLTGDITYDDVTITLHNDYEFQAKKYIESWMEGIINVGKDGANVRLDPAAYKADITVEQLGRTGEVIATYELIGCIPKQMDAIELSHESTDTLEELSVTFSLDYWRAA